MDASVKPKPSTNKAGELVFSTEDTNRVRLALGLRPLSTPQPPNLPAIKAITKNGEISCSVSDTNKLRAALGLRPLRPRNASQPPTSTRTSHVTRDDGRALERRLQKARAARAARHVMAPLSISEQIAELESNVNVPSPSEEEKDSVKKRKSYNTDAVQLPQQLESELAPGQNTVLTLRDKHVLDDDDVPQLLERAYDGGKQDRDSEDGEKSDIDGMNYDGTDTAQFQKKPIQPKNAAAHNIERGDVVVDDDFEQQPAFLKRKRNKRKRKRVAESEPVTKGHLKALRMREQQTIGNESENDDEYYEKMVAARRKSKRNDRDRIAKQILERVDHSESDSEEKAVVFSEMGQLPVQARADVDFDRNEHSTAPSPGQVSTSAEVVRNSLQTWNKVRNDEQHIETPTTARSAIAPFFSAPTAEETKPSSDTNGLTGLAATLKRLRQTGALHRKPEQIGRARDERYDDSEDENVDDGKPKVRLSYTDEFGNKLTPKEAYRLLSHKFHGNAPKQNKREKRLQKMLQEKRNAI